MAVGLLLVALLCAALALLLWRRRDRPGARALSVMLLAVAEWNAAYAVGLASTGLADQVFWAKVQYLGIAVVPLAVLAFALGYSGHRAALTRLRLGLLAAVPTAMLIGAWTNEAHGLIWQTIRLVRLDGVVVLDLQHGPGFYVGWVYSYLLLFAASLLLMAGAVHARRYYRRQSALIAAAIAAPWLANALYVLDLLPGPPLDYTNLGFAVTGVAFAVGCLRCGLFDLVPIARDFVVEHMRDAMVAVDTRGRIIDCNPAAQPLLRCDVADAVGRDAATAVVGWEWINASASELSSLPLVEVDDAGEPRWYEAELAMAPQQADACAGRVALFHDVTAREKLEAHLAERAFSDPLTGLANRRLFLDRVQHAIHQTSRSGRRVAVVFCDLDGFKRVNDTFGHDCGDQLLVAVAHRLEACIRPGDTVARLGGDEFTVLLEELSDADEAHAVACRIAAQLAEPVELDGQLVVAPASIGLRVGSTGADTADQLLREADLAMYTAKRDPSTRLAVFGQSGLAEPIGG